MKHNLRECTFIIPIVIDSNERLENLLCIVAYLKKHFYTKIILVESGPAPTLQAMAKDDVDHIFIKETEVFLRTQLINIGIKAAKTPVVSVYDADVFFDVDSYLIAIEAIKQGAALTYPYGGIFVDIKRDYIKTGEIIEFPSFAFPSYGGACFLNRDLYWSAGLENQHLVGHCPDDVERKIRMEILGHRMLRVPGKCYHIRHPRGGYPSAEQTEKNLAEYNKVLKMTKPELVEYIKTWDWAKEN